MVGGMVQCYVKDADGANAREERAVDGKVLDLVRDPEGRVVHSELDVHGIILAVADRYLYNQEQDLPGNTMQFCLHFSKEEAALVEKAAAAMEEGGRVLFPLGPSFYCALMIDVIDPYGIRWCVFAE